MIVLCNPNNPTGNQFDKLAVLKLIEDFNGLVVIDEAYVDFGRYSLVEKTMDFENLLILRTFSKANALAGLRLGFAISSSDIAKILNQCYQMPYPVSHFNLKIGSKILDYEDLIKKTVNQIKDTRGKLIDALNDIRGVNAFPSDSNFVLFDIEIGFQRVYDALLRKGIIIRKIGRVPGFKNCLRVTVAPENKMLLFIEALKEVLM
jgi:histidinol-phosphate aminotransferase